MDILCPYKISKQEFLSTCITLHNQSVGSHWKQTQCSWGYSTNTFVVIDSLSHSYSLPLNLWRVITPKPFELRTWIFETMFTTSCLPRVPCPLHFIYFFTSLFMSCVLCQMPSVTCHMSNVYLHLGTCHCLDSYHKFKENLFCQEDHQNGSWNQWISPHCVSYPPRISLSEVAPGYIREPSLGSCYSVRPHHPSRQSISHNPSTWTFIIVVQPSCSCPLPGPAFC